MPVMLDKLINKVFKNDLLEKYMDILIADNPNKIDPAPVFNEAGGIVHFHFKTAAYYVKQWEKTSLYHEAGREKFPRFELHLDMETDEIVGFNFWMPAAVYNAALKGMAEEAKRKARPWWKRKLSVLWVHIKWLFKRSR